MPSRTSVLALFVLAACGGGQGHARPIRASARPIVEGHAPSCQIVFFPGLGDAPAAYDDFLATLRAAQVPAETVVLPNRDYGTVDYSERLHSDVIAPAQARGVRDTWLVAVSMGSAPALRMAETHPDDIAGVLLVAPAFGGPFLAKRVQRAGGVRFYTPVERDRDGRAFKWLEERRRSDRSQVPVRLAFGRQDALAPIAETMAEVLPEEHVLVGAGGHDWGVWNELFVAEVESGFFQQSCGCLSRSGGR
ncbi:MAG: hypothetical protein CMN30_25290 [Sandaracinus sp.]|nr:hypothetical protein [Sandaracinus sp.]